MTLHGSSLTIALSIVGALAVAHAAICAYALLFPADVAEELCKPQRSFLAWLFLLSLRIGRYDAEPDLTTIAFRRHRCR